MIFLLTAATHFVRRPYRCFGSGGGGGICPFSSSPSLWRRLLSTSMLPPETLTDKTRIHSKFQSEKEKEKEKEINPPLLMLSSPTKPESRYFYRLTSTGIKLNCEIHLPEFAEHICIGSSHGFLFFVDICESPDIRGINPFTDARLSIPPTSLIPNITSFETRRLIKDWKSPKEERFFDNKFLALALNKTIILSPPSLDTVISLVDHVPAVARVGSQTWTSLNAWVPIDCILHKGLLHGVDDSGNIYIYNLDDPSVPPQVWADGPLDNEDSPLRKALVESPDGEDLFLVFRGVEVDDWGKWVSHLPPRTHTVKVFKLEYSKKKKNDKYWSRVKSIGDLAMFVGVNDAVSFYARDFPTVLQPNTVYFTDSAPDFNLLDPMSVFDTGFCNLREGTIHFYELTDDNGRKLNWPAPVWYMQD